MSDQQDSGDAEIAMRGAGGFVGFFLNLCIWRIALLDQAGNLVPKDRQTFLDIFGYYTIALIITVLHVIARKDIDNNKRSPLDAALCWLWAPAIPLCWFARGWHAFFTKITQD